MFLYIRRNKSGFPRIVMEEWKLSQIASHDLWARNHGIWNPRACKWTHLAGIWIHNGIDVKHTFSFTMQLSILIYYLST